MLLRMSLSRAGLVAACAIFINLTGASTRAANAAPTANSTHDQRGLSKQLQALDIPFVANAGELDARVAFYARTVSGSLFVSRNGELTYQLGGSTGAQQWVLKERFIGTRTLEVTGRESVATQIRRIHGGAAVQVAAAQATYRWADLGEAWPGITVQVRASGQRAEKFFRVAAGNNAAKIRVAIDGASELSINANGELEAPTGIGKAVFSAPVAWQDINGQRRSVPVRYLLRGTRQYGFALAKHDARHEVVIDPLLQSTYLGGAGGGGEDRVTALAIEPASGDVYAVGQVTSLTGFPVSAGALQTTHSISGEAFIARLPADLKSFTQVTYLGGDEIDEGQAIAISPATGDIYIAGYTQGDFPGISGGAVTTCPSTTCAFIARLDAGLATLRQATYYGEGVLLNSASQNLLKLAINAGGDVYLAGTDTVAPPALQGTTGGAIPTTDVNGGVGYIARFAADLKTLTQATYIGGSALEANNGNHVNNSQAGTLLFGLALDPISGDVFVTGLSTSATMPVTPGVFGPARDPVADNVGFIARLPKTLTSFSALSWFSIPLANNFPQDTLLQTIAISPSNGDLYLAGSTSGDVLPASAGGFLTTRALNGQLAEFIVRIAPDLSAIRQSTYVAPPDGGFNLGLRVAPTGDVFTAGLNCPDTSGGIQPTANIVRGNLCIARFTPDLHSLVQATFLGGSGGGGDLIVTQFNPAFSAALAISDANGDVYAGGGTTSTDYPDTAGGAQASTPANNTLPNGDTPIYGYIARMTPDLTGTPQPGVIQFNAAAYSVADTQGAANVTVNRANGSSGAVSVTFATSDATGKAGIDYTATTQSVSFADGDTTPKQISIPVKVDNTVAGNKTVNLALSAISGGATLGTQATAVLTITHATAPTPGTLQFTASSYATPDNAGTVSIGITRSSGSSGAVTVAFATGDGTGKSGTNYSATSQTVTFADGDAATKTVNIPVDVNGTVGSSFTVNLSLTGPTGGATLGSPATAVLTISATTPAPVPVSSTVTVNGKGGGGGIGLLELVVLGALLLSHVMRARRAGLAPRFSGSARYHGFRWLLALGILGAALPASADSPGFYAGFGVGQVRSDASAAELARKLDAAGFPGATVSIDDRKLAGKAYGGFSFNSYLALEVAYVDLNRVRTHSTAATADVAGFVAAVTAIHPYSARGGSFTALASLPVVGGLSVFARGGGFAWHGEIDAATPGIDADFTKKTGLSGVVGAGVDFAFTKQLALRAEWERYFITRDSMDLATIGLRFRF